MIGYEFGSVTDLEKFLDGAGIPYNKHRLSKFDDTDFSQEAGWSVNWDDEVSNNFIEFEFWPCGKYRAFNIGANP